MHSLSKWLNGGTEKMSLRSNCPCDVEGICPYEDMHSGYMNSCEYWCGTGEPQDYPDDLDTDEDYD